MSKIDKAVEVPTERSCFNCAKRSITSCVDRRVAFGNCQENDHKYWVLIGQPYDIDEEIMQERTSSAMDTLTQSMKEDPEYAYGWHCNIAMACYDAISRESNLYTDGDEEAHNTVHKVANEAATNFMKNAFGIDTEYQGPIGG